MIYLHVDALMFQTNKTGTKIVSACGSQLLVFDVINRRLEVTITREWNYALDVDISADGVYLFFLDYYEIPQEKLEKGVKNECVTGIYVFHIKNSKSVLSNES